MNRPDYYIVRIVQALTMLAFAVAPILAYMAILAGASYPITLSMLALMLAAAPFAALASDTAQLMRDAETRETLDWIAARAEADNFSLFA
jgi:hypothetical protein